MGRRMTGHKTTGQTELEQQRFIKSHQNSWSWWWTMSKRRRPILHTPSCSGWSILRPRHRASHAVRRQLWLCQNRKPWCRFRSVRGRSSIYIRRLRRAWKAFWHVLIKGEQPIRRPFLERSVFYTMKSIKRQGSFTWARRTKTYMIFPFMPGKTIEAEEIKVPISKRFVDKKGMSFRLF